jgi:RNA polymerase sigma-70 factor (ECF subfamily)
MSTGAPSADRSRPHVTDLLLAWGDGDRSALDELMPIVFQELRRLARLQMRGERDDHTLQTTALVNEAYLRLIDLRRIRWQDRAHFLALSARLMRRILVDHARSRNYQKRGGGVTAVTLDDALVGSADRGADLVALDDALEDLARLDARKSQVVELRFFGGLSVEETPEALDVSPKTAPQHRDDLQRRRKARRHVHHDGIGTWFRTAPLRNLAVAPGFFHNGAFIRLEDAIQFHLNVIAGARIYDAGVAGVPPDLGQIVGPVAPRTSLDEAIRRPTPLSTGEVADLVAFVRDGLHDPRVSANSLCRLVPPSVPSGRPVLHFEGCR